MNRNTLTISLPSALLACLIALGSAFATHADARQDSSFSSGAITAEDFSTAAPEKDKDESESDIDSLFADSDGCISTARAGRSASGSVSQINTPRSSLSQIRAPPLH